MLHRGPDDSGVFVDGDVGLGMRRLSIVDVAGGHQPMRTADGRYTIVYNGEVYNHLALRESLGDRTQFRSHSDTETVLAAFERWGNSCWAKLEGMFAVAIWDRHTRELTLARDPLGIKPLYISRQHGGIAFGSELKALLTLPSLRFTIDPRSVHDFFSFGHVRIPRSIYSEVESLRPGHFLTVGPEREGQTEQFWKPSVAPDERLSARESANEFRSIFQETTARHMMADVPVGAFLSGGIDSSAVLAAMTRSTTQKITAFTVGYPGSAIDESEAAQEIAAHLGCDHVLLPLTAGDMIEAIPAVVRCFDEPFADMAAVPTWWASRLAAQHVKVVLCGVGGDELFAGYKRHRNAALIERYRSVIGAAGRAAAVATGLRFGSLPRANLLRQHIARFSEFARLPDGYQQFFAATQISRQSVRHQVYSEDFDRQNAQFDDFGALEQEYLSAGGAMANGALNQFLLADLTLNMPSQMLTRLDRASMAHSVEARVPLLSHKLVEWALTVPIGMKLRGATGKTLVRDAIAPWLPAHILRRPKQGFQVPHRDWFRGELNDFGRDVWENSDAASAGYLDRRSVREMFDEHRRSKADHGRMLYAVTVFALWWDHARRRPT
jgi:asparagine synthase (glutamine-hydrolysing)